MRIYIFINYLIMKNFKRIIILIISSLVLLNQVFAATEYNISSVSSTDENMVNIFLDNSVYSEGETLEWEAKVFKDTLIQSMEKNVDNENELDIVLSEKLKTNSSYSFLSVYWVEGNMDFVLTDEISGVEILNPVSSENVEKIFIEDESNIQVFFKTPIVESDIEVKVLKDLQIDSILLNMDDKTSLSIVMQDKLEANSKYILMMFSLNTQEADELSFVNAIYDFQTDSFDSIATQEMQVMDENLMNEEDVDDVDNWELANVALNAAQTPDTWAETWILIALTLFLSSFVFLRKRFSK